MSLGIALSGGGAKGAAHIGVLKALKDENIKIDYISGTSSGSIIAALYAAGYTPNNLLNMFNGYCKQIADYDKMIPFKVINVMFTGKLSIKGLAKGDRLESIIREYLKAAGVVSIKDAKMPLAIPTVDVNSGEIIYYLNREINKEILEREDEYDDSPTYTNNGDLASIVRASSSFPGVFEPKALNNRILVDGGVRMNTPVTILRQMGADKVIAVCFEKNKKYKDYNMNAINISMKAFDIMGHQINEKEIRKADLVINPVMSQNISLLDCSKTNILVNYGYYETKKMIESIRKFT